MNCVWYGAMILCGAIGCCHVTDATEATQQQQQLPAITELRIGPPDAEYVIIVYISPTCIHCGTIVVNDLLAFVQKHGNCRVALRFLVTSAKDIFLLKLIWNKTKDAGEYFRIYQNLMKRMIATIDHVTPQEEQALKEQLSEEQWEALRKSDILRHAVVSVAFGFTSGEMAEAIPVMDGKYEREIIVAYKMYLSAITKNADKKEVDLPMVMAGEEHYKNLSDAAAAIQQ